MSRFILPNPTGAEYALRVLDSESGDHRLVPLGFEARFPAYVADPSARDWLDRSEAEELRELLNRYLQDVDELPERVSHAIWLSEYSSRVPMIDIAWPQTVTALEALLNTDRAHLRRQFVTRVAALAAEFGIQDVDPSFADDVYTIRSQGVHGTRVAFHADPTAATKLGRLRNLLGLILRRTVEDRHFREVFENSSSIRARWPVSI